MSRTTGPQRGVVEQSIVTDHDNQQAYLDCVMSSKATTPAAKTSVSDNVDVSFATDEEDESSSSSTDESVGESSSESDEDKKSDDNGDADDESDMPTFTLSLQTSTAANDVDDMLPDLSGSATSFVTQETTVTQTSSVSETETKKESVTSESSVKTVLVSEEVENKLSTPSKEEVVGEFSEESEESEEDTTDEEEDENDEEQKLPPGSSPKASIPTTVSTHIDTKENLTVSSSKSSVIETIKLVEEGNKEVASEATTTIGAEQPAKQNRSDVGKIENTNTSDAKLPVEKPSTETIVVEPSSATVKIETNEKLSDLSKTSATVEDAASDVINDAEVSAILSASKSDERHFEKSKDSAYSAHSTGELECEKAKEADSTSVAVSIAESNEIKHDDGLKETRDRRVESIEKKTSKLTVAEETGTIVPKTLKSEESNELGAKQQNAIVESQKLSKSRRTKEAATENKQEVASTVEEDQIASVAVVIKQTNDMLQSPEVKSSKTISDADSKSQANLKKTKKCQDLDKSDDVKGSVVVEKANTSEKSMKDVKASVSSGTTSNAVEVVVNAELNENERATRSEMLETKLTAKKKSSKISTVDGKESKKVTIKNSTAANDKGVDISAGTQSNAVAVAVNGSAAEVGDREKQRGADMSKENPVTKNKSEHTIVNDKTSELKTVTTVADDLQMSSDRKFAGDVLQSEVVKTTNQSFEPSSSVAASKTDKSGKSSVTAAESETEKSVAKNLPHTDFDETKVTGSKLNDAEDEGKLVVGDDAEFRPRRNSIDEFIKRILAEAREEQKKILDSCAMSSAGETTSDTVSTRVADDQRTSRGSQAELEQQKPSQQQQQSTVSGVDVAGFTTRTAVKSREDLDIDEELADISRYYAKRTLLDRALTNGADESADFGSTSKADDSVKSKSAVNGDDTLPPTADEEVLHFVPQRREATASVVRESARPVRALMDQQARVIRQLSETSRAMEELDNEIRQLRQSTDGRDVLYASIGAAIHDELRVYELELSSAGQRLGQQRLPGGGRFIREEFVAQCASELLRRSTATNGPRLERAATVDDWTRVGRRGSGSSSVAVEDDLNSGSRSGVRAWISATLDRNATDLLQYRHSRSGSVVSDRGYSSIDAADESNATATSSLLSRLTAFNVSSTPSELDFTPHHSRASSEAPRPTYSRSQSNSDDWASTTNSAYSVGRQYAGYRRDVADDTNGDQEVGFRVARPVQQYIDLSYRRYQPQSIDSTAAPYSRLYVRRGSLQSYSTYDSGSGGSDVGRSFNSRFLSRVREKKALGGDTTTASRQTSGDRPFRSRFLKSSNVTGSTSTTYSLSRSTGHYNSDDN